jgi:cytochrome P450
LGSVPICITALNDPRLTKDSMDGTPVHADPNWPAELQLAMNSHMLATDPPGHTRLRRLVSSVFTSRRIADLRPQVQRISADLLDGMAGRDRDGFRDWSNTIVAGAYAQGNPLEAARAMNAYIRELVAFKRSRPDEALLSALISVADEGDRLTEDELTSMVFLLLIAGHETTVNLIGNGVYLLLEHPDQMAALRAEPRLPAPAIEEFLRYESPVKTATFRKTAEAIELDGATIPAGAVVMISLLSANHGPQAFADPAASTRPAPTTSTWRSATASTTAWARRPARLEGQIAFAGLPERFPKLRPARPLDELAWRSGARLRGLDRLPVMLT